VSQARETEPDLAGRLNRIEALVTEREPVLCALLPEAGRFARLRSEARALTERWPEPAERPPLFGVVVGVKDIFHVDGFATRAGSRLPPGELAGRESEAVRRLKAAGALILGKTVTTEFAYFQPGPTRNPWDPERTPGGSSSGSAAAVAAGFCDLALGTQTIGSISRPASFCGIVGFKPSFERISREGVIPLSPSLDHVGLFATRVADAERAAAVLCDGWSPSEGAGDRPVLAVPTGPYLEWLSDEGAEGFRSAIVRLEAAGYAVREVEAFADFDEIAAAHRAIVAAEAAGVHQQWFERFGELYGEKTAELIETGRGIAPEAVTAALAGRERVRSDLAARAEAQGCRLWISPAARGAAPEGLERTGDPIMNLPWTYAGLPSVVLPAATTADGLPLGLQIVAGSGEDERLLWWAAGLEAALAGGWRGVR
jgi:Asp-tRNA(Asn)/Glu-tRNA(Gln) amidotransferase A subunit family amidase